MALSPAQSGRFAQTILEPLGLRATGSSQQREGFHKTEISFTPAEVKNVRHFGGIIQIGDGTRQLALTVSTIQQSPDSHVIDYQSASYTEGGKTVTIDLAKDNATNRLAGEHFLQTITTFGQAMKDPQAETPFVDLVLADTMQVAHNGSGLDIISKVAHAVELAGKPGGGDGGAAAPVRAKLATPRM